jgi:hypothetical protein
MNSLHIKVIESVVRIRPSYKIAGLIGICYCSSLATYAAYNAFWKDGISAFSHIATPFIWAGNIIKNTSAAISQISLDQVFKVLQTVCCIATPIFLGALLLALRRERYNIQHQIIHTNPMPVVYEKIGNNFYPQSVYRGYDEFE